MPTLSKRARWFALGVLCLGTLMIVLDTTIVNVALPSIRTDLGFSEASLAWVVNAYLLTFGGFLLLGGRLGDLFGHRRLFISGIVVFTLASLACGFAGSQWFLIAARAIQGLGGAVVSAVSLSLMMTMFSEPDERARAMGFLGFVAAGGGSIGVLLGGFLTTLNWHWIFLVNIPVGAIVFILSFYLLPHSRAELEHRHLDAWGALLITAALVVINYAIVGGNAAGWLSSRTLGLLSVGGVLLVAFLFREANVKGPLMPLRLFRVRNIWASNVIGVLWAAAMFAWFFLAALYAQVILGYTPLEVGLSFLPANLIMALFSVWLSAKTIGWFGLKRPLAVGLSLAALGLLWLSRAPVSGSYLVDILPSMILLGFGAGLAFNPVLLAAMSDARPEDSGLASGLVNTSFMMGGAIGLAVLVSLAAAKTSALVAAGSEQLASLNAGYHLAFLVGACFAALAALLGVILLRAGSYQHHAPMAH